MSPSIGTLSAEKFLFISAIYVHPLGEYVHPLGEYVHPLGENGQILVNLGGFSLILSSLSS
jgi:hypothetical protein